MQLQMTHFLAEVVVALSQAVYIVREGAISVDVQVELVSVPEGGLECPIDVTLSSTDGRKASMLYNAPSLQTLISYSIDVMSFKSLITTHEIKMLAL